MKNALILFGAVWLVGHQSPPCTAQEDTPVESFKHVPADDGAPGSTMTMQQLQQAQTVTRQEPEVLVVQPAAEPTPALKYRFHPAKWELRTSSALLHYNRAQIRFLQMPEELNHRWQSWSGDADAATDEELAEAVTALQPVYTELHALAMSDDLTWDHRIRDLRGPAIYTYTLPDVQEVRAMARLLDLKIRHQLKQRNFDGAISSISDGLRLSQFVGQGETLIQKLVGSAIGAMMRGSIKEAISTPGCPNLYWALASIPRPMIDISDSVLWELTNIHRVLPALERAETADWSEAEALREWTSSLKDLETLAGDGVRGTDGIGVALAIASVTQADAARQRLADSGFPEERLANMPALQIVLIDASRELRRIGDDMGKAHLLPTPLARPLLERAQEGFQQMAKNRMSSVATAIATLLFPAVRQANEAETRLEMYYNQLMTLEALRMHAAEHDGELPESLDELGPVPAMPDPYTGKAFEYTKETRADGTTVVLKAAGPEWGRMYSELHARFEN